MLTTLLTAAGAYIGAAADDLFTLMRLFSKADTYEQRRSVLRGQLFGIALLTSVSLSGAAALRLLPPWVTGLTGLIPLALGLHKIFRRQKKESAPPHNLTALRTALWTAVTGADRIGVWTPLFAGYALRERLLAILLFAVMTVLWCVLGAMLSAMPHLRETLQKYTQGLSPAALLLLGLYILLHNLLPLLTQIPVP